MMVLCICFFSCVMFFGCLCCVSFFFFFFFKQKTAYEMRISDWSSDVCSSDLLGQLDTLLVSDGCRFRLRSPRLTGDRAGTGDLFAALLVARLATGSGILSAAMHAVGATTAIIERDRKSTRLNSSH